MPRVRTASLALVSMVYAPVAAFAAADLAIVKTGASGGVKPTETIVYTLVVTNNGPDPATGVTVADPTPDGLVFVSNAGDCITSFPCNLGSLAAGQSRSITASFRVPAAYSGPNPIQNQATVTSSTSDGTPGNNSSTALTAVTRVTGYYTLPPCRVADTRGAAGVPIGGPALAAGAARTFDIRRRCGLPDNAIAVSYNVTVTAPTGAGDLRIYPGGTTPPLASVINYVSGQTRANSGVVPIGSGGGLDVQCDQAAGLVDFIMDVNGYFAATDSVATPVGQKVRVRPAPEVEITFDNVTQAGITSAAVIEFADNRPGPVNQGLRAFFAPGSPLRTLLPDIAVPSFVQPLPRAGGPPTFVLSIIDTTAGFTGTAEVRSFEEFRLGWNPPCSVPGDRAQEPRTFYAREAPKGEPAVVEEGGGGPVFVNVSAGCGEDEARAWAFSLYLRARDTRTPAEVATFMLDQLQGALTTLAPFITSPAVADVLDQARQSAVSTLGSNPGSSYADMTTFVAHVTANPGAFNNGVRNVSGELEARARATRYNLGKLAPAATVVEFPLPTPQDPCDITEGPDGNLWFTSSGANKIGRMTPAGAVTEFVVPTTGAGPRGIVAGPDGNLWFVEPGTFGTSSSKIGRLTPSGAFTEFPTAGSLLWDMAAGPDGNLWFARPFPRSTIVRMSPAGATTNFFPTGPFPRGLTPGPSGDVWFTTISSAWVVGGAITHATDGIGRISSSGAITEYSVPAVDILDQIVTGPDGNLWFPAGASKIWRSTPSGQMTEFALPPNTAATGVAAGSDGNVWMAGTGNNTIGFVTPTGTPTLFPLPTPNAQPCGITQGPDGAIWFTERNAGKIGRISP